MSLGTVGAAPPPLFKQGPTARSKLWVLSALALLLMVLDARLHLVEPLRQGLGVALLPVQWLAQQPLHALRWSSHYLGSLEAAQREAANARAELVRQAERAAIVEHLAQENRELRALLDLRERLPVASRAAPILYQMPDPARQRVVIGIGQRDGVRPGSAVMDGWGVFGQVTRVHWASAEVTLLSDSAQAIPVINTRTGQRSLAFGLVDQPDGWQGVALRFEPDNTQAAVGDVLTTSGIDGVYPPGLPVAQIEQVSAVAGDGFAQVKARLLARSEHALHVLVIDPVAAPAASSNPETSP